MQMSKKCTYIEQGVLLYFPQKAVFYEEAVSRVY